jgi:hypothetical protein
VELRTEAEIRAKLAAMRREADWSNMGGSFFESVPNERQKGRRDALAWVLGEG